MKQYKNIASGALAILEDVIPKIKAATDKDKLSQDDLDVLVARIQSVLDIAEKQIEQKP